MRSATINPGPPVASPKLELKEGVKRFFSIFDSSGSLSFFFFSIAQREGQGTYLLTTYCILELYPGLPTTNTTKTTLFDTSCSWREAVSKTMDPPESISGAAAATPATPTTATTTTAGTTTATVTTPTTTTPRNGANTDSMVTVPLSDIQSNPENSPGDWRSSDVPPIPPVDIDSLTEQQQQQHDHGLKSGDVGGPPLRSPSSERNDTSDVEGDVVDWAQLDKTEEQEPRGDSSDEVGSSVLPGSDGLT